MYLYQYILFGHFLNFISISFRYTGQLGKNRRRICQQLRACLQRQYPSGTILPDLEHCRYGDSRNCDQCHFCSCDCHPLPQSAAAQSHASERQHWSGNSEHTGDIIFQMLNAIRGHRTYCWYYISHNLRYATQNTQVIAYFIYFNTNMQSVTSKHWKQWPSTDPM